jgi:hypothetical protein
MWLEKLQNPLWQPVDVAGKTAADKADMAAMRGTPIARPGWFRAGRAGRLPAGRGRSGIEDQGRAADQLQRDLLLALVQ